MSKTQSMFDDDDLQNDEPEANQPPSLVDALTKTTSKFMTTNYGKFHWTNRMPKSPVDIANWWLTVMRKPNEQTDHCQQRINPKTLRKYWHCPYQDLAKYLLNRFLSRKADFQELIIDASLDGLHWTGESMDDFISVREEFRTMQEIGPEEYKQQALKKMRTLRVGA